MTDWDYEQYLLLGGYGVSIPHRYGITLKSKTLKAKTKKVSIPHRYGITEERRMEEKLCGVYFVSIPHRYGITKMGITMLNLPEFASQFLIGTVLHVYKLQKEKVATYVSIPHRYGITSLDETNEIIKPLGVSIPHRYGITIAFSLFFCPLRIILPSNSPKKSFDLTFYYLNFS